MPTADAAAIDQAPKPPSTPMGKAVASGGIWLGLAQGVRVALTFVSAIVLARLLSPDDFGVIAMVAPVLALVAMFQDLGLSTATIQARTLDHRQSNAMFWLSLGASIVLCAAIVAIAPLVGWFYGDPRAAWVTAAGAATVLVSATSLQHSALLNREMRFASLGLIDICGLVANYSVAIALAAVWPSYWVLFLGALAGTAVQSAAYWRASRFRPSRPSLRGGRALAHFGADVTGFGLLNFCVRNVDNVLVAHQSGAAVAGLYDRSYRLMMMPLQNINGPLLRLLQPVLSRLRDEPGRYRRNFVMATRAVMLASVPGVAVATALSDRLMPWLLGAQWGQAGPIFFWLGLVGLLQPVSNLTGVLFISSDRSRAMLKWGAVSAVVTLVAFAIGLRWGAVGIAAALFWSLALRIPFLFWWCTRGNAVRQSDLYASQIEPLVGPLAIAVPAALWGGGVPFTGLLLGTLLLAYPAALLTSCITPGGRRTMMDLWIFVRKHFNRTLVGHSPKAWPQAGEAP